MNHIIIVEGPDNIGKTILVELIAASLKPSQEYEIWHSKKPAIVDLYKEYKTKAHKFVEYIKNVNYHKNNYLMICDRSFLGELVYPEFRGNSYTADYVENLYTELKKLKTVKFLFIGLYGDQQTSSKFKIQAKADEVQAFQKAEMMGTISTKFFNVISNVPFGKKLLINSNNYSSLHSRNDIILEYIAHFLSNRVFNLPKPENNCEYTIFSRQQNVYSEHDGLLHEPNRVCAYRSNYDVTKCKIVSCKDNPAAKVSYADFTGNFFKPSYVFIGEVPGYTKGGTVGLPWYRGPAATLFQSMLYELEIPQTKCLMTNTVLCPQESHSLQKYYAIANRKKLFCVSDILNKLLYRITIQNPQCKMVALGQTASSTLHMLGFNNIIETNHPSWFLQTGKRDFYFQYMRKCLGV